MSTYVPDGWAMVTGTWNTDAELDTTTTGTIGDASVKLKNTAVATEIAWDRAVSVKGGSPYRAEFTLMADSIAAGDTLTARIRWYTSAGVYISDSNIHAAVLSAASSWIQYSGIFDAPSTARMAKLSVLKAATTFNAWVDFADLFVMPKCFFAYLSSSQAGVSTSYGQIQPDTEVYDYGSTYNTGTFTWTCPESGIYTANAAALVLDVDTNESATLVLMDGASYLAYGTTSGAVAADDTDVSVEVNFTGYFTRGSTITMHLFSDHAGTLTIYGAASSSRTRFAVTKVE